MVVGEVVTSFLYEYAKEHYNYHLYAYDQRIVIALMILFFITLSLVNYFIGKRTNIKNIGSGMDILFVCLCTPLQMFISVLIILSLTTH